MARPPVSVLELVHGATIWQSPELEEKQLAPLKTQICYLSRSNSDLPEVLSSQWGCRLWSHCDCTETINRGVDTETCAQQPATLKPDMLHRSRTSHHNIFSSNRVIYHYVYTLNNQDAMFWSKSNRHQTSCFPPVCYAGLIAFLPQQRNKDLAHNVNTIFHISVVVLSWYKAIRCLGWGLSISID